MVSSSGPSDLDSSTDERLPVFQNIVSDLVMFPGRDREQEEETRERSNR